MIGMELTFLNEGNQGVMVLMVAGWMRICKVH